MMLFVELGQHSRMAGDRFCAVGDFWTGVDKAETKEANVLQRLVLPGPFALEVGVHLDQSAERHGDPFGRLCDQVFRVEKAVVFHADHHADCPFVGLFELAEPVMSCLPVSRWSSARRRM